MQFWPKDEDPRLDERSARFHARVLKEDLATLPFVLNTCNRDINIELKLPREIKVSILKSRFLIFLNADIWKFLPRTKITKKPIKYDIKSRPASKKYLRETVINNEATGVKSLNLILFSALSSAASFAL